MGLPLAPPPNIRDVPITGPLDLRGTLAATGKASDPGRSLGDGGIWRVYRSPDGPVSLKIERTEEGVRGLAWGPGSEHALGILPDLVGAHDDPTKFVPHHDALRDLYRRKPGLRFGKTHCAVEALIKTIPGQRVTAVAAKRTARELVFRFGDPAPGPVDLRLPADPERIANLSYENLHGAGLERSRASTILEICRRRKRIEQLGQRSPEDAVTALQSIRGIGPWTANRVAELAWGWTDAVQTGDYWLPSTISWILAGEARADDARMLELLEPYRPHRARAVKLAMSARIKPPRFGPRLDVRDFRSQ